MFGRRLCFFSKAIMVCPVCRWGAVVILPQTLVRLYLYRLREEFFRLMYETRKLGYPDGREVCRAYSELLPERYIHRIKLIFLSEKIELFTQGSEIFVFDALLQKTACAEKQSLYMCQVVFVFCQYFLRQPLG